MKELYLKIGGVVAIVLGSAALYLGGVNEAEAIGVVGGVFVVAGLIAALFKKKKD